MLAERINAKEIYSFNEGNLIPKHDTQLNTFLGYFVGISLPLILIMRLSNLISFNDFSWYFKSVYVGIICYVLSVRGSVRVPQPMEIWFYDDYMILYRPKRVYKKSSIRREFHKFYYKDIHRIEHRTVVDKIAIYGVYEGKYYRYNKNTDIVQDKPSYHRTVDAIDTFYIMFEKNIDFLGLLKKYTGLDIEISHS